MMLRDNIISSLGKKLMRIKDDCFMYKKRSIRKEAKLLSLRKIISLMATRLMFEINNPTKKRKGTVERLCVPYSF